MTKSSTLDEIKKLLDLLPGDSLHDVLATLDTSTNTLKRLTLLDEQELELIRSAQEKSKKSAQEMKFLLMVLRSEILHALAAEEGAPEPAPKAKTNKIKFGLLIAGGLVVACEGFDCVATMMGIFSLPSTLIIACGITVSLLGVLAFCGLDLMRLARGYGVKFGDAHKLLDAYVNELNEIKQIRRQLNKKDLAAASSIEELKRMEEIAQILKKRLQHLIKDSEFLQRLLNHQGINAVKFIMTGISASIFFGGGFCAGQTVSLYVCSLLFAAATPASLPVILFSSLVGLAAFALYWYVDTPSVTSFVSSWFGLSKANMNTLADKDALKDQERKLDLFCEKVQSQIKLQERLQQIPPNKPMAINDATIQAPPIYQPINSTPLSLSQNSNGFWSTPNGNNLLIEEEKYLPQSLNF